jgi:hypothetical protein
MPVNPRVFSPAQFIRIFVIVNLSTYITVNAYLGQTNDAARHIDSPPPKTKSATTTTTSVIPISSDTMGGKKGAENTKKVAGNARKAEAAAQKQSAADAQVAAQDDDKWSKGSKDTSKKEVAAAKAAAAAAKKAEREAMLAEEEKAQRATPKGANKKTAEKKSRGTLDLGQLDEDPSGPSTNTAINASGIDNALDALSLTTGAANDLKVDRHPERRYKAAYKAYEERRLPEIELEHPGLRKNQRVELVRKEFEKSEENPFNQAGNVRFDATRDELHETRQKVREGVEKRLAER